MIKKLIFILLMIGKKKIIILVLSSFMLAGLELVGIGLLVPFIGILNDVDLIKSNQYLSFAYELLGFSSVSSFIISLGFLVILAILLKNVFSMFAYYLYYSYSLRLRHKFSIDMFSSYLSKNYSFFINEESSHLLRNILELVNTLAFSVIVPLFLSFTNFTVIIFMLTMLLVVQLKITLILLIFFSVFIPLLYYVVKNRLHRYSDLSNKHSTGLYRIGSQAFHGIKDIKVLGKEFFFYKTFKHSSAVMSDITTKVQTINQLPYLILEFFAILMLILVIIYFVYIAMPFSDIFVIISFYAIAAYRLLPRASEIPKAFQLIKSYIYSVDITLDALKNLDQKIIDDICLSERKCNKLDFNSLELKGLNFKYSKCDSLVLKDINLIIEKNKSNAFVGTSGAGKTTIVDIMLGLFPDHLKNIFINGKELNSDTVKNWMANIGYIPQHIYLYDDTISSNIAFGVPTDDIDHDKLDKAIKTAMLSEFIYELKDGKNTIIGERGIKLSGGQRQRIGIARALYNDPDLLIMDEATSALDNLIEMDIVNNINNLSGTKTLIIIAHRLTTIKNCDVIHVLDKGKVICSGSYDYLIANCKHFNSLANGKRL